MPSAPKQACHVLRTEHTICSKNKKDMTTNNNKRQLSARLLAAALTICLYGCSGEITDGNTLPAGKYPMTFTAAVDGLMQTRATTTGGTTSWQENDLVAICMDGGTNHKQYKITDACIGAMSPNDEANTLYWSKTQETLAAWYPVSCTIGSNTDGNEVSITDQSSGFGMLENILHAPAKDYTFNNNSPVAFHFRHALAKVKVTLKKGEGMEGSDLSNATIRFMGYTEGTLGYGGMTGSGSNGEITPHTETSVGGGNSTPTTYTALVIPQQMQGEKFIQVTVGTDDAARDYFYIPTGTNDANLEAGKQYTYTITVKKTGLQVESVTASWNDNASDGDAASATFKIHLADFAAPTYTSDYKVTDAENRLLTASDGVYSTASNAINISLSASEGYRLKKFLTKVTSGICKQRVAYTADTRTYTYTFYDIHSDLWLSDIQAEAVEASFTPAAAKVGDYYYADGTWSDTYTNSDVSNPCIGIVFKVGTEVGGDNINNYNTFFIDNAIHGYVVALADAHTAKCAWGGDGVLIGTSTDQSDYMGYSNSLKILAKAQEGNHLKPDDKVTDYPAMYYISEYEKSVSAPATCSGWYFPSTGQLKDIYDANSTIQNNFSTAGGSWFQSADYLSSSEYDRGYISFNVGCVFFSNGSKGYKEKDSGPAYVRAILTF